QYKKELWMMKRIMNIAVLLGIIFSLIIGITTPVFAVDRAEDDTDAINEKLGVPIVVLGDTLTNAQKEETRKLLGVDDASTVDEYTVDGQDIAHYIDGNPNSRMFSSAKITREEEGKGLTINIVTPENITEVTNEMYANALLTAGAENALAYISYVTSVIFSGVTILIVNPFPSSSRVILAEENILELGFPSI